jgi:LuxR family maltose regulon positive regulatory protein
MSVTSPTGVVPRRALEEKLERGAEGPVTVVAASAGSGKTLLVRSWLQRRDPGRPAAWVSVERDEHDAQRFWGMVIAEIRAAAPDGAAIEPLAPTPEFAGETVVRRLSTDLAALEAPLVLVIDDLHELVAPDALAQLSYLVDHLPEHLHVVLISRRDPSLPLHRRRLAGELTEVRSADLRFTLEDTGDMLSRLGISLSAESTALLHERTEGWVAGLRLAAMSLSVHPDPEGFVAEFSGSERTVAAYLLDEVLVRLPEPVRRLLVRTSLLSRVNGELGDLLTGDTGTERELQALADAGGFVVALDASRTWFRLHHLFADLLKVELRNTAPDQIQSLHARAARWFAEHGYVLEAIGHAEAAGDHQQAAGLLTEHYFGLTLDGRRATAHALLDRFDEDAIAASPELATVRAAEDLLEGSFDRAAARLGRAAVHADAVPVDRRDRFAVAQLVTRISLARRVGDIRSVVDGASPAFARVELDSESEPPLHDEGRALALMNLGIVETWSGRFAEGERHLREAQALATRLGRPYLELECRAHLASALSWRSFTASREAAAEVINLAERYGWGTDAVIAPALVTLGTALLQGGRLDEAERWLARASQTLRAEAEPAVGLQLQMAQGGLLLARRRASEALAKFRGAERLGLLLVEASPLSRQLLSSTLRSMIETGDAAGVREVLQGMSDEGRRDPMTREIVAWLALADGDPTTAIAELQPLLGPEPDVHHVVVVVRALIVEALARDALGDIDAVERAVERALELAEADSLVLPFLHTDSRVLLERHPRYRTAHGALIDLILDVLSGGSPAPDLERPAPLLEPLSEAELRVLGFLPTNLSAAGIASEIYVSVHTVKTHMRHIYAKLDVHDRAAAVRRARALGLLGRAARRA